jgi:hypothetical protein
VVQASRGDAPPVVEDLARRGMKSHEPALRLAAERAPDSPRTELDGEAGVAGGLDDLPHRAAVVLEVVLGERVQHTRVAAGREVGHVTADVAEDPHAEVRAAGGQGATGRATRSGVVVVITTFPPTGGWFIHGLHRR